MTTDEIELLTPADVCEALKVSKDWLYDQVQAGHFPVQRLPGSRLLRFRRADIVEMLNDNYEPPAPPIREVVASPPPQLDDFPMPRVMRK